MDKEERYKLRINREKKARKEAEKLLQSKARELFHANEDLRESQEALKLENERRTFDLIRVQRLAKIASWRWHIEKQYILWSDEIDHILELSNEDSKRERFWRTICYLKRCRNSDRHKILNFMRKIVRSNKSEHTSEDMILEHELHFPDDSIKIIRFLCECTYNDDGTVRILIGTVQDITTQKNYERELLRKEKEAQERVMELEELHNQLVQAQVQAELENRTKSEFLSTVNHELRTPLTSIHGALELIRQLNGEHSNDRQTDSLLDIAYRNSERLKFLVNDILDTEKIDSHNIEFYYGDHKLEEIIETSIVLNDPYAKKYNVTYRIIGNIPDVIIRVDKDRILQAITNLLSNASKFSNGNEYVDISTTENNGKIDISVKDYGVGMPDSFKQSIFKKFAQADASDAREKEGTGLGLYITKSIIERHKGEINYISEVGKGTTFTIKLPYVKEVRS